jgi:hypothetical protein
MPLIAPHQTTGVWPSQKIKLEEFLITLKSLVSEIFVCKVWIHVHLPAAEAAFIVGVRLLYFIISL